MRKTIFITITRSFIIRNILRSGTLDYLKREGYDFVIFFQGHPIPEDIVKEFACDQVMLVSCPITVGRVHRRAINFGWYVISTKTTRLLAKFHQPTSQRFKTEDLPKPRAMKVVFRRILIAVLSFLGIARKVYRLIDTCIFSEKDKRIQKYFDEHNPVLVFSTSIESTLDVAFMKEAKRRRVKTASMPKSWDNAINLYYRFIPDYFFVQNDIVKQFVVRLQDMPSRRIIIIGVPQFDWYRKNEIIRTREEHFKKMGLDPERALIFFGSEGLWTTSDYRIAETIYRWIQNNELAKPCQLLARPHYTNITRDVFKNLRNRRHVVIDDYPIVPFLPDQWNQSKDDIIDFTNSVMHCDMMVNIASTLSLDAACADKPIINIGFGCSFQAGKDITFLGCYTTDHFGWVMDTNATDLARCKEELKEKINKYLLNPSIKSKEREVLRKRLCYCVDGQSSKRLADAIHNIIKNQHVQE